MLWVKGEHRGGLGSLKNHQTHPLPAAVGVQQEGEDGGLGLPHAFLGAHGAGRVHHQEDVTADFALPHLVADIRVGDGQGQVALVPHSLVGGRGPERRVQGQVRHGRASGGGPDIAAGLVVAPGPGAGCRGRS